MISSEVISTNVVRVGWDNGALYVEFKRKDGSSFYEYPGVPMEKYTSVVSAASVGKAINAEIKPFYEGKPVDNPFDN